MALIGKAAMLLWYDIVPEHVAEHDEWHTREHFPERVGIPGFLRAQRWVARDASPRYLVTYEVRDIDVLTSDAYAERLNHPTPWTQRMMPQFRGMVRGFCRLEKTIGSVLGATLLAVRYAARPGHEASLQQRIEELLTAHAADRTFASAFMLRADAAPPMTAEQQLRGRDASVERVVLVTSYAHGLLETLQRGDLCAASLEGHGAAPGALAGIYDLACRGDAAVIA